MEQYRQFLPGQRSLVELRDWMRQLLGFDMLWDLQLVLKGSEVPALALGRDASQAAALGRSTWLGARAPHTDRGDLRLNPASLGTPQPS